LPPSINTSCKPPARVYQIIRYPTAFVNTPRYSEVLLAGAGGFYLSLLERVFHVKILCPLRVFLFHSSLFACRFYNSARHGWTCSASLVSRGVQRRRTSLGHACLPIEGRCRLLRCTGDVATSACHGSEPKTLIPIVHPNLEWWSKILEEQRTDTKCLLRCSKCHSFSGFFLSFCYE
jgi:hypothetical protein